ncbi:hypothetical protein IWW38_005588, partial [Coemansia aciculifera]
MEATTLNELHASLVKCVRAERVPWSWVASTVGQILEEHSSGVSRAVVLAELESAWHKHTSSSSGGDEHDGDVQRTLCGFFLRGNTAPQPSTVFSVQITKLEQVPGTSFWMWHLSDNRRRMAAFVHSRFYPMIESREFEGFFAAATGRQAYLAGLECARGGEEEYLLPTAAVVFMLDAGRDARLMRLMFGVTVTDGSAAKTEDPEIEAGQVWGTIIAVTPAADGATTVVDIETAAAGNDPVSVVLRGTAVSSLARGLR